MTIFEKTLYVIAVLLAVAFVQRLLPESPLGFGVFWLIFAVFAHPIIKWKSWTLVVIGAAVASGMFYVVKRTSVPLGMVVPLFIASGVAACIDLYYKRVRNRPS